MEKGVVSSSLDEDKGGMDVVSILAELQMLLQNDSNLPEGIIEGRTEIKEKLDNLTSLVSVVGPMARKEAIEAKPFKLLQRAWRWPLPDDVETEDAVAWGNVEDPGSLSSLREAVLRALNSLTPGYPEEVADPEVVADMVLTVLKPVEPDADLGTMSESLKIEALKATKHICLRSERNREFLTNYTRKGLDTGAGQVEGAGNSLIAAFCDSIKTEKSHRVHRAWCETLSALVLNDDRRVVTSRGEERKRLLAEHGALTSLIGLSHRVTDPEILNAIVIAISMMATSRELCNLLLEAGALGRGSGVELILQNFDSEARDRMVLNAILCVRNLSLGPNFSKYLEKSYIVRNMVAAADRMKGRFSHVEVIMSSLGYITIHSPTAVTQFLVGHGIKTTLGIMEFYKANQTVLKSCCLILENVILDGGDRGKSSLVENEAEARLQKLIQTNPALMNNFLMTTQRDLGLLNVRPLSENESPPPVDV